MACPDDSSLAALVRGQLTPATACRLQAHLAECEGCRSRAAKVEVAGAAARSTRAAMPALEDSPETRDSVPPAAGAPIRPVNDSPTLPPASLSPALSLRPAGKRPSHSELPTCAEKDSPAAPSPDGKEPPPVDESGFLRRGTSIGRYLVLDPIGEGGMGQVYGAFDPELDRKVAIKLLRARPSRSRTTSGQARLIREAQAMARLSHPHVVSVHDVGAFEDRVFVAMEFVDGMTLKEWMYEKPHPWRESLAKLMDAGRGVAAAHAAGLVHRDFKPDNVLLGKDGRIRVTDFGLARAAGFSGDEGGDGPDPGERPSDALSEPLTRVGAVMGTPGYMAPEQLLAEAVDARTDQFSFCVSLFEALFGERPFAGKGLEAYAEAISLWKVTEPPKDSPVPAWVRRILWRGMSRSPADRFPTLDALLDALGSDPGVARRKWLTAGAVALGATALVAAAVGLAGRQGRLCRGAESRLAGTWDSPRKGQIEAAFLGTGRPYAADSWKGVEKVLDGWTNAWVAMHVDSCEATRLRGEQSEAVLTLRMACLDRRLMELRALSDVLGAADAVTVEKAVSAAYALPEIKGCADTQALLAKVKPPSDPAVAARVATVRERLARAKALFDSGRLKEAQQLAGPAAAEAKETQYRPVEGEALFLQGFLHGKAGEFKAAEQALSEGAWAAMASHDDEVAGRAGAWLAFLIGYQQSRFDESRIWAGFARACLERLGGNDALEALLDKSLAAVSAAQARYADALALDEKAVALYTRALGPEHPETLMALNNLGADLHDMGQLERGAEVLRRALAASERTLGPEHPDLILQVGNLAEALNATGHAAEGLALSRRAVALGERNLTPQHRNSAWAYTLLSQSLTLLGQHQEARAAGEIGLARLEKIMGAENPEVGKVHELLGTVELGLKRPEEALRRFDRAIQIKEKGLGKDVPELADALTGLGRAQLALGKPGPAAESLERALKLRAGNAAWSLGAPGETRLALAQALWEAGKERERAVALAGEARDEFARYPFRKDDLESAETWLRAHGK